MSKNFHLLWSGIAQSDLEEIAEYIAFNESVDIALAVFSRIKKKCNTLSEKPFRCRVVPELAAINIKAYRELIVKPYRIVFRIESDLVYILGVFDSRRDLEQILINRITSL